jgi:hypothetical protein
MSNGQQVKNILIDASKLEKKTLYLSEISEKATPITLETSPGSVLDIWVSNEYLFVATMSSVYQFTPSGKYIRKYDCGGMVCYITCDSTKKELYVLMKEEIKSFNFSGELKKTFKIKYHPLNCEFHNGILWIQSYYMQETSNGATVEYFLSNLNLSTGKEDILPLNIFQQVRTKESTFAISNAGFIRYNHSFFTSFHADTTLYQVKGKKVSPVIKWKFVPYPKYKLKNGIIGNYLFIYYKIDDEFLTYFENLKSKQKYIAKSLVDDIFNTGEIQFINPFNKEGHIYFARYERELKKTAYDSSKKDKLVLIIAKIK